MTEQEARRRHPSAQVGPEPEFVQRARRTVEIAEMLDGITAETGWGMATAWACLRDGELDDAEKLAFTAWEGRKGVRT